MPVPAVSVGVALAVVAWPALTSLPGIGIEGSWVTGLHLAFRDGLNYGEEIIYTLGPLGFLAYSQPYFGVSSAIAFVATAMLVLATCITLALAGWRLAGGTVGTAVAFAVAHLMAWTGMWELFGTVAVLWTLTWMLDPASATTVDRRLAVLGAIAAIGLLGKFNIGALLAGAGAIAALTMPAHRPRGLAVYGLAFAATLTVVWLVTGQETSDLGSYLRLSAEVAAGYSSAMGTQELEPLVWQLVLVIVAVVLLFDMLFWASSDLRWPRRVASGIVLAAYALAYFKAGFVRWDAHVIIFFASVPVVAVAFLRSGFPPIGSILKLAVLVTCFLIVAGAPPTRLITMGAATDQLIDQVATLASPSARRARFAAAIGHLQSQYALAPDLVDDLRGRSVHVEPAEAAVVFAYPGMVWRPLPIFQSFTAFTPALDDVNAAFLRSSRAPELILQRPPAPIDGRNPWFDSPEAMVEMVCHYRQVVGSPVWRHVGDQCGRPERPIAVIEARPDEIVRVPAADPGELLLLRITGLNASLADRLQVLLWKSDEWRIDMHGRVHRLVPSTASQPLLLTPPIIDGPATGELQEPPRTVRLFPRPMLLGSPEPLLTFAFSALRLDDP